MRLWIIILFLGFSLVSCGPEGSISGENGGHTMTVASGPPPFSYTITPENIGNTFRAYGETRFIITHNGECEYAFNLLLSPAGNYYDELVTGIGENTIELEKDLPTGDYLIESLTNCEYRIEIFSVNIYAEISTEVSENSGGNTNSSSNTDNENDYCQGCCSSHGGVDDCKDGVTKCVDGTPLSDICVSKGCNTCQ